MNCCAPFCSFGILYRITQRRRKVRILTRRCFFTTVFYELYQSRRYCSAIVNCLRQSKWWSNEISVVWFEYNASKWRHINIVNPREKFVRDRIVNVLGNWKAVEGASHASDETYSFEFWTVLLDECRLGREKSVAARQLGLLYILIIIWCHLLNIIIALK